MVYRRWEGLPYVRKGPKKEEGILLSRGLYQCIQAVCVCVFWSREFPRKGRVCAYILRGDPRSRRGGGRSIVKVSIGTGRVCVFEEGPQEEGGVPFVKGSIWEEGPQEGSIQVMCVCVI